ncbi:MAG: hypothetical protein BZ138_04430 [Methanosphaera sp. rholeuAM270]|nr:MAG: hypothetical protein BZ138_04430 [Methanosphaera sp. rholeuAM270]
MQDLQKEVLSGYDIEVRSYVDNVIEDIPAFLGKVNDITLENPGSVIQLFDSDYICGMKHLNQAIVQAIKAFDEGHNFANDRGLEVCVRLSAQKQISQALRILGIKNRGNVTVLYINTDSAQIRKMEDLLVNRDDSIIEDYDVDDIRNTYSLDSDVDIVDYINEKIALLAFKT